MNRRTFFAALVAAAQLAFGKLLPKAEPPPVCCDARSVADMQRLFNQEQSKIGETIYLRTPPRFVVRSGPPLASEDAAAAI